MSPSDPADFVRRFAEWWRTPDPTTMGTLLAPHVLLVQPLIPPTSDLASGQRAFGRLFTAIPDLTARVHRWAASGSTIYIEFTLSGTLGGRPVSWENVDRFIIGPDGLATERVNYHDSVAVGLVMLRRPKAWISLVRSRLLSRR